MTYLTCQNKLEYCHLNFYMRQIIKIPFLTNRKDAKAILCIKLIKLNHLGPRQTLPALVCPNFPVTIF